MFLYHIHCCCIFESLTALIQNSIYITFTIYCLKHSKWTTMALDENLHTEICNALDFQWFCLKTLQKIKTWCFRGKKSCLHNVQSKMKTYRFKAFNCTVLKGDWIKWVISLLLQISQNRLCGPSWSLSTSFDKSEWNTNRFKGPDWTPLL